MEGGPADPLYVPAAQPDIIRAAQKDQLYIDVVTEAFQEAARGIFGPRRALLASRCAARCKFDSMHERLTLLLSVLAWNCKLLYSIRKGRQPYCFSSP